MDFHHDKVFVGLERVKELIGVPDWVKSAEAPSQETIASLPDEAFAWPSERLFPTDSSESTFMSAAYYLTKSASELKSIPDFVRGRIYKAAYGWKIDGDILKMAQSLESMQKKASDDDYGLIVQINGHTVKKLAMRTPDELLKSASYFAENFRNYPLEWRRDIATKILEKNAAWTAIDEYRLPSAVLVYGRHNVCDSVKLAHAIASRVSLAAEIDLDVATDYQQVAKSCGGNMCAPEVLEKVAHVLGTLDRASGLDRYYDEYIPDPDTSVYNLPVKVAEDAVSVIRLGNDTFNTAELADLPMHLYEGALGKGAADALAGPDGSVDSSQLRQVLPTLPMDMKSMLVRHLKSAMTPANKAETLY